MDSGLARRYLGSARRKRWLRFASAKVAKSDSFDEEITVVRGMKIWALLNDDGQVSFGPAINGDDRHAHYYYGQVNAAGRPHGKGAVVAGRVNGYKWYEGEWLNGSPHGRGIWLDRGGNTLFESKYFSLCIVLI